MQGRIAEATSLARRHSHAPHFSRSLEWLLFTALEFNADDMPAPAKSAPGTALSPQHSPERPRRGSTAGSLLLAAAALIRTFPQVLLRLPWHCSCALVAGHVGMHVCFVHIKTSWPSSTVQGLKPHALL